jgi:hypothetical protein
MTILHANITEDEAVGHLLQMDSYKINGIERYR